MKKLKPIEKYRLIEPFLNGEATLADIAREVPISYRTLHRWAKECRARSADLVKPKTRSDKSRTRKINTEAINLIEGLIFEIPKKSFGEIYDILSSFLAEKNLPIPSQSTVRRVIKRLPQAALDLQHKGAKFYENTYELVHRREAKRPNQIWQADHTLLDICVLDERGQEKRPWLTVIIDDFSRAISGYYLYLEPPTALQTALTLREAIWYKTNSQWLICGIPEVLYTDHGRDFTSEHIETVCAELKIKAIFSSPGKPRGRGRIERFFSSLNQKFLCRQPGYTKRKARPQKFLSLRELDERLYEYFVHYHNQIHSATKTSPIKRWNQQDFIPQMPQSLENLNLLLLRVATARCVQRDGIKFHGFRYVSPILAAYIKEPVTIRYNPKDLAEIWVYHENTFICKAVCQALQSKSFSLKEIVSARRQRKKELKQLISSRKSIVDSLLGNPACNEGAQVHTLSQIKPRKSRIKLYENDD